MDSPFEPEVMPMRKWTRGDGEGWHYGTFSSDVCRGGGSGTRLGGLFLPSWLSLKDYLAWLMDELVFVDVIPGFRVLTVG